jgi:hypothetical protein
MFTITIGRKDRSVQAPVQESAKPKRAKGAWKGDPISPKQIGLIASQFRAKGLVVTDSADNETVTFAGQTYRYDKAMVRFNGKLGGWTGLDAMTKGEAGDLIDKLMALPMPGFSPVTTSQAEPTAPTAPKTYGKGDGYGIVVSETP